MWLKGPGGENGGVKAVKEQLDLLKCKSAEEEQETVQV